MPSSASIIGFRLRLAWEIWPRLVRCRLVIRCWVRWLGWLMIGVGRSLGGCLWSLIRGLRIMW